MTKRHPSQRERKGRELEELVAALEGGLRPEGVVVKSPDWLRDRDTGGLREVDVSIRVPGPPAEKLVVLECRHRRAAQDVRWFEELASKRESVGADQMIAVSSSPFTAGALKKAERYGILARRLSGLSLQSIVDWLWIDGTLFRHESQVVSAGVVLDWTGIDEHERPALEAALGALPRAELEDRNLIEGGTEKAVSVIDAWNTVLSGDTEQVIFGKVPESGERVRFSIKLDLSHLDLRLSLPLSSGRVALSALSLKVDLWKVPTKPRLLRVREYREAHSEIARAADFALGGSTLTVQKNLSDGSYALTSSGTPTAQHSGKFALWNPGPQMKERILEDLAEQEGRTSPGGASDRSSRVGPGT